MLTISTRRPVFYDGCECGKPQSLLVQSLACRIYDLSTANPFNPQGTAGGGNVLNAAPLFGNSSIIGSGATDSGAAGTGSAATAALGGPAIGGAVTPLTQAAQTASGLLQNPLVIMAIAAVGLIVAGFFAVAHFHRKKK